MSDNCGCNGNHEHDHECCGGNCGHDHDHEHETLTLELEDGTDLECVIIGTYLIEDISYIALLPTDDESDVLIYRYEEIDEESIDLINIEDDEEFETASEAFFELFVEEDDEE